MLQIIRALSSSRVSSSVRKIGVRLGRGWCGRGQCCPITAVIRAEFDPTWNPDGHEPGDDLVALQQASERLGVPVPALSGFVAGWDDHGFVRGRMSRVGFLWARVLRWRLRELLVPST